MKEIPGDFEIIGVFEADTRLNLPFKAEGFFHRSGGNFGGPFTDKLVEERNKTRPINLRDPEALARVILTHRPLSELVRQIPGFRVPWGRETELA